MDFGLLEMLGVGLLAGACGGGLLLWLNLRGSRPKSGGSSRHRKRRRRRRRRSSSDADD